MRRRSSDSAQKWGDRLASIGRRKARPGKLIVNGRIAGKRFYRELPDSSEGETKALECLLWVKKQAALGLPAYDDRTTLADYYETWMQATKHGLAYNTLKSRVSTFKVHVLPALGQTPLFRVNRASIRSFLAGLLEQGPRDIIRALRPQHPRVPLRLRGG